MITDLATALPEHPRLDELDLSKPKASKKNSKEPELVPVLVRSYGNATIAERDETGKVKHYFTGSINGVPFKLECNKQVLVSSDVAELCKPYNELAKGLE